MVLVIGGGAAGLMAAGRLCELGVPAAVVEHKDRTALKLGITGKGRCNLTNDCAQDEFLSNIPRNPRFLYTALSKFSPRDAMAFFESLGVPLKTERGKRVFPVSDRSLDVVAALRRYSKGAELISGFAEELIIERRRERRNSFRRAEDIFRRSHRRYRRAFLSTTGSTGADMPSRGRRDSA